MDEAYLWLKAMHLIAVISWLAGLLYLPRLYVYHVDAPLGSQLDQTLQTMERRLYYAITTPAMVAALVFGIGLIAVLGMENLGGWFHLKMTLLLGLFAVHGILGKYRRAFANGTNTKSSRYFRILNEVPTVLMVVIVLLAVLKPF